MQAIGHIQRIKRFRFDVQLSVYIECYSEEDNGK